MRQSKVGRDVSSTGMSLPLYVPAPTVRAVGGGAAGTAAAGTAAAAPLFWLKKKKKKKKSCPNGLWTQPPPECAVPTALLTITQEHVIKAGLTCSLTTTHALWLWVRITQCSKGTVIARRSPVSALATCGSFTFFHNCQDLMCLSSAFMMDDQSGDAALPDNNDPGTTQPPYSSSCT